MEYSDPVNLLDESDGEDECDSKTGNLDANALLERRRREAYHSEDEMKMTIFSKLFKKKKSGKKKPCLPFQLLSIPKKS